jgi:rhodanese-related sulfurtransferase
MTQALWLLLAVACGASDPQPHGTAAPAAATAGPLRKVDVAALQAALGAQQVPILVDVRSPEEFASGHVAGAKNIPLPELGARLGELAPYKDGEVWLICEVGGRSARAASLVSAQGFKAVDVGGGTAAWRAQGLPLE